MRFLLLALALLLPACGGDDSGKLKVGVILPMTGDQSTYGEESWNGILLAQEELKEEVKRNEGDPHVRARVRQVQREMAQRRMMEDTKTADAVVTNAAANKVCGDCHDLAVTHLNNADDTTYAGNRL